MSEYIEENSTPVRKKRTPAKPALKKEESENPRTGGGKLLQVVRDPRFDMFKINFKSGGQLPRSLMGHFTRYEYAEEKIKEYLNSGS